MFAQAVSVEAGQVCQRVHQLVGQAVKQKIDVGAQRSRRAASLAVLVVFQERPEVLVGLDQALTDMDPCGRRIGDVVQFKPAPNLGLVQPEIQRFIALAGDVDRMLPGALDR